MKNSNITISLKAKTRKELAHELGMSERAFYRWIKEKNINLPKGKLLLPETLILIYTAFYGDAVEIIYIHAEEENDVA